MQPAVEPVGGDEASQLATPESIPLGAQSTDDETDSRMPGRTIGDLAMTFMERRNIRWGELVSGLLIVGSATGLVISLWSTVNKIPYFPALLFLLVTLALHGAGRYTLSRWRLRSTSQGLLLISTLLVPLNCLAAVALSRPNVAVGSPVYLLAITVGLTVFAAISYSSGRRLMLVQGWLLVIANLGPCISQIVVSRAVSAAASSTVVLGTACLSVVSMVVANAVQTFSATRWRRLTERRLSQILLVLGITTFSLTVSLFLLIWKTQRVGETLSELSPLLALVPISIAASTLVVYRRVDQLRWSGWRTVMLSLTIFSAMLMLVVILLAWPDPHRLLVISLIGFTAFSLMAWLARVPILHVPAALCAALTVMLCGLFLDGSLGARALSSSELTRNLLSGASGLYLMLATIPAGCVAWFKRWRLTPIGTAYQTAHPCLLAITAGISFWAGWIQTSEPQWNGLVMLVTAGQALYVGDQLARRGIGYMASILSWFGLMHLLSRQPVISDWLSEVVQIQRQAELLASLSFAGLGCAVGVGLRAISQRESLQRNVARPLAYVALVVSGLTFPAVVGQSGISYWVACRDCCWLVAIWLLALPVVRRKGVLTTAQVLSVCATYLAVVASSESAEWWSEVVSLSHSWLIPRFGLRVLGAFAVLGLAWHGARLWAVRWSPIWEESQFSLERLLIAAAAGLFSITTAVCCVPAVIAELPTIWPLADAAREIWCILGLVLASFAILMGQLTRSLACDRRQLRLAGMFALAVAVGIPMVLGSGFSSPQTLQFGSQWTSSMEVWIVLLLTTGAAWEAWRSRRNSLGLTSLVLPVIMVPLLAAAASPESVGAASVLRWQLATVAVLSSGVAVWWNRAGETGTRSDAVVRTAQLVNWFAGIVILSLTVRFLLLITNADQVVPDALLENAVRPATAISYLLPLVLLALSSAGITGRLQRAAWLVAALWYVPVLTALGYVLGNLELIRTWRIDAVHLVQFISMLSVATAGITPLAVWLPRAVGLKDSQREAAIEIGLPVGLSTILVGLFLTVKLIRIVCWPYAPVAEIAVAGHWSLLAAVWTIWGFRILAGSVSPAWNAHSIMLGLTGTVVWTACAVTDSMRSIDQLGADAVLSLGVSAIALIPALMSAWLTTTDADNRQAAAVDDGAWWYWSVGLVVAGTLLLSRLVGFSPTAQQPFLIASGGLCLSLVVLAGASRNTNYVLASMLLPGLLAALNRAVPFELTVQFPTHEQYVEIWLQVGLECVLTIGAAALFWHVVEIGLRAAGRSRLCRLGPGEMDFVGPVTQIVILVQLLIAIRLLVATGTWMIWYPPQDVEWWNLGLAVLLAVLALGSRVVPLTACASYGTLLLAEVLCLRVQSLPLDRRILGLVTALSLNAVIAAVAYGFRRRWLPILKSLGAGWPVEDENSSPVVLGRLAIAVSFVVVLAGFPFVLTASSSTDRLLAAGATLLLLPAVAVYADVLKWPARSLGLALFGLGLVQLGWAVMEPSIAAHPVLMRSTRSFVVLAAYAGLLILLTARAFRLNELWRSASRSVMVFAAGLAVMNLAIVLMAETSVYFSGVRIAMSGVEIAAVAVSLLGMAAGLIVLAVQPERDPLELSDSSRTAYVYVAECLAGILFLHFYFTVPELFTGMLSRYWPFIVMAIAYVGVGVGEFLDRHRIPVLAQPLQRTGTLLPLLPAMAFWVSDQSGLPLYLFLLGLLYVMLSNWKQSFGFAVAAAVAGNGALWALYHDLHLQLLSRPQVYLIPPALSVLIAAHVNRRRLAAGQLAAIRYASTLVIYVSSTGEMFIHGLGENMFLPMALALLSVIGVFAGIVLHVRSFLYVGTSFLVLSIVSMVWHATKALDHSWPWWVFGIGLGVFVLVVFGVFEKRRNDMQRVIDNLRRWEQ